ncbi:MAG TPA: phospho-sugar mutase [Clostridiaceae bacterium]|nr:phospho-sugar mutase [Clostridiaceae bacterium]
MNVMDLYKQWSTGISFDLETKAELLAIKDNPDEIRDRFYKELEFGTAGVRGLVGAGTNRMNVYVVRKLSNSIAQYVMSLGIEKPTVMIGYDSRNHSLEFAKEAAAVFAGNGIKVYMHSELCPVPAMSYSIRLLKCTMGVLITASHNPKEYNGYKVFGAVGSQLAPDDIEKIKEILDTLTDYSKIPGFDFEYFSNRGKITKIGVNIKNSYLKTVRRLVIDRNALSINAPKLKLVYTPLHGAGINYVPKLLKRLGFKELYTVKAQMTPDGNFPTVTVPNPEDGSVYELAIKLADEKGADLILATDPDADRAGAAVKNENGEYILLNGNQIGILLLDYIITTRKNKNTMPENPFVVSTVVSTRLTEAICKHHDIEYIDVFTGFKYIGGAINKHEDEGGKSFLFGFEESYGYLPGSYARDKDGIATCVLLAEVAAYYNAKGMNLLQALDEIYAKYGYHYETQVSLVFQGETGLEKSKEIMARLREMKNQISEMPVTNMIDYLASKKYVFGEEPVVVDIEFDKEDVLYYSFGDNWAVVRPSGTEPKIKVYFGAKGEDMDEAKEKAAKIKESVMATIKKLYE